MANTVSRPQQPFLCSLLQTSQHKLSSWDRASASPCFPTSHETCCSGSFVFPLFHSGSPLMLIVCRQSLAESVAVLWFICWLLLSCPDQWRKCFDVNELQTISLNTKQGLASQRYDFQGRFYSKSLQHPFCHRNRKYSERHYSRNLSSHPVLHQPQRCQRQGSSRNKKRPHRIAWPLWDSVEA